ncbi:MAG: YcaO-like family protein [Pseudomonadota bacterium]
MSLTRSAADLAARFNEPTRKIPGPALRVSSYDVTEQRALAAARHVPVTRLAELGPLDRSRPHVYSAITPLARDLTTHLGKGTTAVAARVSALMEAIERTSAERPPDGAVTASFDTLAAGAHCVPDPHAFTLPPQSLYDPARTVTWLPGIRIRDGAPAHLPADLVLSPPDDGLILQPDTNGLASGNTRGEAIVHGLCELIERDAVSLELFERLHGDEGDATPPRPIAMDTLPDAAMEIVARISAQGHHLRLYDVTREIAVPVLAAYLDDPAYPSDTGPRLQSFFGFGCAPDPVIALLRALTEAEQSRVCILQGARDSFNEVPVQRSSRVQAAPEPPEMPFSALPVGPQSSDLMEDLAFVMDALAAAGFDQVFAVDLTRSAFGLAVVRVRVAGLSQFIVDRSRIGDRELALLI